MPQQSKRSIYAALAGNVAVALVKLAAFFASHSSAMLVEAIHSLVDTLNQLLLLVGLRRGQRPPDEKHPFGYGLEAYFWTFVVALLIFVLGGLASIYEGIDKLQHPQPVEHAGLALAVIGICTIFDIWALVVGLRAAEDGRPAVSRKWFPRVSFAQSIHVSADPAVFEVLAEDSASLLGLAFAAAGIMGSAWFGWAAADGLAALAIGLLLMIVAGVLIRETHSLLTGEAAAPSALEEARTIFSDDPRIDAVCEVLSMQLGPKEILMAATLDFRDDLSGPEVEAAASELTARLQNADPRITRLFLRPGKARLQPRRLPATAPQASGHAGR